MECRHDGPAFLGDLCRLLMRATEADAEYAASTCFDSMSVGRDRLRPFGRHLQGSPSTAPNWLHPSVAGEVFAGWISDPMSPCNQTLAPYELFSGSRRGTRGSLGHYDCGGTLRRGRSLHTIRRRYGRVRGDET